MQINELKEQGIFESFGYGSLLLVLLGFFDLLPVTLTQVFASSPMQIQYGLDVAVGAVVIFLLFGLGRACSVLGASLTGVSTYQTYERYHDFLSMSLSLSERDWALFMSLRRDLAFIDGITGVFIFLFIISILGFTAGDWSEGTVRAFFMSVIAAFGGLSGAWQNRTRVCMLRSYASTKAAVSE